MSEAEFVKLWRPVLDDMKAVVAALKQARARGRTSLDSYQTKHYGSRLPDGRVIPYECKMAGAVRIEM
jgi:hypothetical protein